MKTEKSLDSAESEANGNASPRRPKLQTRPTANKRTRSAFFVFADEKRAELVIQVRADNLVYLPFPFFVDIADRQFFARCLLRTLAAR
jgi:hypothetical protein